MSCPWMAVPESATCNELWMAVAESAACNGTSMAIVESEARKDIHEALKHASRFYVDNFVAEYIANLA